MGSVYKSSLIITVLLSTFSINAGASNKADTIRSVSMAEISSACEQTEAVAQKAGITSDKTGAHACIKKVEEYYEKFCSQKPEVCEKYTMGGFVLWIPFAGGEVNVPMAKVPYVKGSRFDVRGSLGISYLGLMQEGTNKPVRRVSIVTQAGLSIILDKISSAPGGASVEGDTWQTVLGGITLIMVPRGKTAKLAVDGLFAVAGSVDDATIGSVASQIYKSQVGAVFEGKSSDQSDLAQTKSWLLMVSTNAPGIVGNIDSMLNLTSEDRGTAVFISGFSMRGKIRTENKGVSMGPIVEFWGTTF